MEGTCVKCGSYGVLDKKRGRECLPCLRAYNRERNRVYRERHREDVKKRQHQWYTDNKPRISVSSKIYRDAHKAEAKIKGRQKYLANREEIIRKNSEYQRNNPEKMLGWLIKRYGLTVEDFKRMESEQGGRCAICNGPPTEKRKRLSVDHNHTTGKVRGLLCGKCNTLLGVAQESVAILETAIKYLKEKG